MEAIQTRLDQLSVGIRLSAVEFREIIPTPQLAAAFENVQSEQIRIETRKREAEGFAARTLPEAEADRYSMVNEAIRFRTELTTTAKEEVTLFEEIFAQYLVNRQLVWTRLYLEAMEFLMRRVGNFRFVPPDTRLIISPVGAASEKINQSQPTAVREAP